MKSVPLFEDPPTMMYQLNDHELVTIRMLLIYALDNHTEFMLTKDEIMALSERLMSARKAAGPFSIGHAI